MHSSLRSLTTWIMNLTKRGNDNEKHQLVESGKHRTAGRKRTAKVEKLLRSAIANWEQKNERKAENGELYVTTFFMITGSLTLPG